MLTKSQLEKIQEIIRKRFLRITYETVGDRALTEAEVNELKRLGVVRGSVRHLVDDGATIGKLVALLPPKEARELSFESIKRLAGHADFAKTTDVEKRAAQYASEHAGQYIRGIGDDLVKETRTAVARSSMTALRMVREKTAEAILTRKTRSELKTVLFDLIDNKYRDWQRVAHTEMNDAIQNGIFEEIKRSSDDGLDQLVFKRPNPDACKWCKKLYLKEDGITPRVFRLTDLAGSNVGLKSSEWKPTVGSVHPWCFPAGHKVTTRRGDLAIESVVIGDEVFTHRGRWRKVTRLSRRQYSGDLISVDIGGKTLRSTPEHPYLFGGRWVAAHELRQGDNLFKVFSNEVMLEKTNNKPSVLGKISESLAHFKNRAARFKQLSQYNRVNGFAIHAFVSSAIVDLSKEEFSGLVYNLAVDEDESYLCEGVVTHNCQCQLHPVIDGFDFQKKRVVVEPFGERKKGQLLTEEEWSRLSTTNKKKTGFDSVLVYTGTTAEVDPLGKSLLNEMISDEAHDECLCEY